MSEREKAFWFFGSFAFFGIGFLIAFEIWGQR
jgi:hypothetical protein